MPRVRIVTDSAVCFTAPDFLARNPVTVAPMTIRCGARAFPDGPYTEPAAVRALLEEPGCTPHAEPPSATMMAEIYGRLQEDSDRIVSIHASSSLTGTVANARAASLQFLGRSNLQVIDSQTVSCGLGLLVEAAAEAAGRDETLDEIVRIVRGMVPRVYTVFFLDDMAFLERNRLVSRSQAILGNMLGVIPFLTMEEGKLVPMEKVRSRSRALEKIVEFVSEFSHVDHLAILQGDLEPTEETRQVAERLQALHPHTPITLATYTPSLATFVGLNGLGVVVLESEEEAV